MPDLRPLRIDLPDSTSQEPAPEKKPVILSLIPVTVVYTESIPLVAAALIPFQIELNAHFIAPQVPDQTPLIVFNTELIIELTAPIAVETMLWMPVHTVSMMD